MVKRHEIKQTLGIQRFEFQRKEGQTRQAELLRPWAAFKFPDLFPVSVPCNGREIPKEAKVHIFSAEQLIPAKQMVHGEPALGT